MASNKETLKKKISALRVVTACFQFIKHNRKHSTVNKRKRKCWVKPLVAEKHKGLYRGLVPELSLHEKKKKEFRTFL